MPAVSRKACAAISCSLHVNLDSMKFPGGRGVGERSQVGL